MRILVLEAAAVHLGFVGCYGNDWVATPNLDRLAADGVVFDQHFADPMTAHDAGVAMRREAVPSLEGFASHAAEVIDAWLASDERLLWIDGPDLAPPWRLSDDLLTTYLEEDDEEQGAEPMPDPATGLTEYTVEELDRLQSTYAAVVTFFDAQLGALLDRLTEAAKLDDVLLCVTARHGLPLGEHGVTGVVRPWQHEELVHLPLIVRLPGGLEAGARVMGLTQPVDLLPTLLGLAGLPVPEGLHGHALWPLVRGEASQVRPCAHARLRIGEREEWLLRTPDWAFLLPVAQPEDEARRPRLYVKPDDRWEVNDLAPRLPEEADRLERVLRQLVASLDRPGPQVYPPLEDPAATEGAP